MQLFQEMVFVSCLCGVFVFLAWAADKILGKWYQPVWRYYLWLILGLRLLIPVDLSVEQAPIRLHVPAISEDEASEETAVLLARDSENTEKKAAVDFGANGAQEMLQKRGMPNGEAFWYAGMMVWFCGFVCMGGYFVFAYRIQLKRLVRFSLPELDREICGLWEQMLREQGIRKKIPVYRSEYIYAPMLIGVRKKYLLLPEKDFQKEEFVYIFRHEMKHLVHHHMLMKLVGLFLCCVYWFQPMVWLMKRELDRDIEVFCDEKVVQKMDQRERYGYTQTMIACMAFARTPHILVSSGFGGTVGAMKERIRLIMKGKNLKKGIGIFAAFAVIMGAGNCLVAFGSPAAAQAQTNEAYAEDIVEEPKMPEDETYAEENVEETEQPEMQADEAYAEDDAGETEQPEMQADEAYAEDDAEETEQEVNGDEVAYAEENTEVNEQDSP